MATISKLPSGKYQAKIRRTGFWTLSKTFFNRSTAQVWARRTESELERALYLDLSEAQSLTLSSVLNRYSLEIAVESIEPKIGCVPQRLLDYVKRLEVDAGTRPGTTTAEMQRIKELEREVKELRRANDSLRTASAFFAQAELDRKLKS